MSDDVNYSQEGRFVRMEERIDRIRADFAALESAFKETHVDIKFLAEKLEKLCDTIDRWRYIAIGGVAFYVISQVGLLELLKSLF